MTHIVLASTVKTLRKRHFPSLRAAAYVLGFDLSFAPTLGRVLSDPPGAVSLQTENSIRVALGLPPRARRSYLRPCLALDPAVRAAQLRRLLAAAEAALEETT